MIFEQIATGARRSYLIGCSETSGAALIDPELSQIDHYIALATRDGLRIRYLIDTHTHAVAHQRFDVPACRRPPVHWRWAQGQLPDKGGT